MCSGDWKQLGGVSSGGQWTFNVSLIVWSFCWTYFDLGIEFQKRSLASQCLGIWSELPPPMPWSSRAGDTAQQPHGRGVRLVGWREGGLEGVLFTMVQNRDISKYKWLLLWLVFSDFLLSAFLIPLLFSSFIWYIWEPQETNFLQLWSFWIFGPCVNKHICVRTVPVSILFHLQTHPMRRNYQSHLLFEEAES